MRLLLTICLFAIHYPILSQGPIDGFFKGQGNADVAVGFGVNRSSKYTGSPDSIYNMNYSAQQFNLFGQYGITDYLDIIASLPFVFGKSENKFQDLGLHFKYRPVKKSWNNNNWTLLFSSGFVFPASNYQADVSGALGRREKKIPFRLINQLKLNNGLFFNLTGAYFLRLDKLSTKQLIDYEMIQPTFNSQQPSDYYSIMARIGWGTTHHFIETYALYQNTISGIDYRFGIEQPIQLYEVDFLKVGGTYYYGGKDNGVALNISYIPGLRRNIGNIIYAGVSFILKYRK